MATIHLIDASPYIFRAYFSLPDTIKTPDGEPANAVLGYTEFLIQVLKKQHPTHIGVAFDGSLTTSFRNEIYPEYKAHRVLPPEELEAQIDNCFAVTEAMGMIAFIDDIYEADDIIATLTAKFATNQHDVVIISNDKDLTQLVDTNVKFWHFANDKWFDSEAVVEQFGVLPGQIVDFLALTGDSVDNIPGVKGIGKKTAIALLKEYGSVENIYEKLDTVEKLSIRGSNSIRKKLDEGKELAQLSKKLVRLAFDAPVEQNLDAFVYHGAIRDRIDSLFEQLGFEQIRDRIPKWKNE